MTQESNMSTDPPSHLGPSDFEDRQEERAESHERGPRLKPYDLFETGSNDERHAPLEVQADWDVDRDLTDEGAAVRFVRELERGDPHARSIARRLLGDPAPAPEQTTVYASTCGECGSVNTEHVEWENATTGLQANGDPANMDLTWCHRCATDVGLDVVEAEDLDDAQRVELVELLDEATREFAWFGRLAAAKARFVRGLPPSQQHGA